MPARPLGGRVAMLVGLSEPSARSPQMQLDKVKRNQDETTAKSWVLAWKSQHLPVCFF